MWCLLYYPAAHVSGQVFKGDVILTVNGTDVTHMTVGEVVSYIYPVDTCGSSYVYYNNVYIHV